MPVVATAGGLPTRLGKYEMMMPLAAGGMALIYIARTTGIGSFERHVVLKIITPERANDETAVQMFLDEARLAASLNHQNVAQVFEVGEDGGIHYLAMEYVHGQDLRALLAKAGGQGTRVPLDLALTTVAGAAAGLHHAHERRGGDGMPLGIVHRDVSPSNIMIGYDGSVKLLDFGIAKASARTVETQSGIIKGKFAYMAPEQCRGREVDRRSDVFSLGIILYEITTQHRCFRADSDFDTMHRIVTGDVVRPTRLVQNYPQALEAVVMKALAVDPNQRYQNAGQLLEAIESFAVSARMSLSTMSLGRFMRDLFGDIAEPWLTQLPRTTALPSPKEATISNTNPSAERARPFRPSTLGNEPSWPGRQSGSNATEPAWLSPSQASDAAAMEPSHPTWPPTEVNPVVPQHPRPPTNLPADRGPRPATEPRMIAAATVPGIPPGASQRAKSHAGGTTLIDPPPPIVDTPFPPPPIVGPSLGAPQHGDGFGMSPGSSSGAAHHAMPVGTAPSYPKASGLNTGDMVLSRGDRAVRKEITQRSSPDLEQLQLRPRWKLVFIGVGILLLAALAVIAIGFGGPEPKHESGGSRGAEPQTDAVRTKEPPPVTREPNNEPTVEPGSKRAAGGTTAIAKQPKQPADTGAGDPQQPVTPPVAPREAPPVKPATITPPEPPVPPQPDLITVQVRCDQGTADVYLDGKRLGVTPLETRIPRGKGKGKLVVKKAKYLDHERPVDRSGDFEVSVTLKPKATRVRTPREPDKERPEKPSKPDCQPPNAVNPFDSRPICKG
ncbi:MAG: protein kinase [Kofleriaceae bacterium]